MAILLRASLISLAATTVSLVAGFASNIIAARLLGPGGSGMVAWAIWIATTASALADMGLPQTLLRSGGIETMQGDDWRGLVGSALRAFVRSVTGVAAVLLIYALYASHRDGTTSWLWIGTAALFISYTFGAFSTAVARGRHRFGQTAVSTLAGGLLQVPLVFIGAWLWGPAGALLGHVARYLPQAVRIPGYLGGERRSLTPDMRRYGRWMWLSDLIEIFILSRIEFLFLGIFFASTQIGLFAAGLTLAGLVEQMALQISPALIVGFGPASAQSDGAALERDYRRVVRLVALAALPVSLGGAAIMPDLMPLLFGPAFQPAVTASMLVMAAVWLPALGVIPWGLIGAAGRSGMLLRIQITSGVITILSLLAIVPWAGIEGAAVSRGVVNLVSFALLSRAVTRYVGPRLPMIALAKTSAAALMCAGAASVPIVLLDGVGAVALGILAGALVYLGALRLFRVVDIADAALARGLAHKLPEYARPAFNRLIRALPPR
jgi:O-antigen/teichoic acid export membrane protein